MIMMNHTARLYTRTPFHREVQHVAEFGRDAATRQDAVEGSYRLLLAYARYYERPHA